MSELYTSLCVSPKKKRCDASDDDDDTIIPKRFRTVSTSQTPPIIPKKPVAAGLPHHLSRLHSIQSSLHQALSHSLATSAVSPTSDTGIVPNVLNNHTLTAAVGLTRSCTMDDLKRLCWLWEWDGKKLPEVSADDDNPFLEISAKKSKEPKQWIRGGMGMIITPTSHLSKTLGKRIPAYGIGIEVEMDIDKEMTGGMAAVARWAASGEQRMAELTIKLRRWIELHQDSSIVPHLPLADLPALIQQAPKQSALTQRLASLSPKSSKTDSTPLANPLQEPPSPSSSKSSEKPLTTLRKRNIRGFAVSFPITPTSLPRPKATKSIPVSHLETPSSRSRVNSSTDPSRPSTPTNQIGPASSSVLITPSTSSSSLSTPSTSRRAALYERVRKRSESQVPATPSKGKITSTAGLSKDQLLKLSQEEMRRRCLLGRLGGVAESVWMYFASPSNATSSTHSPRKRRTLPASEVVQAVIKSSPVPISSADALESISLITSLCPFFLKQIEVGGEEWLEMPAPAGVSQPVTPSSPSRRKTVASDEEIKTLSPKRIKREVGGLREVRERIKRELESLE